MGSFLKKALEINLEIIMYVVLASCIIGSWYLIYLGIKEVFSI